MKKTNEMKKILSIAAVLVFTTQTIAQINRNLGIDPTQPLTSSMAPIKQNKKSPAKGNGPEVYWSDDFSNGFAGQGDNGDWTTGEELGSLWFQTFPVDAENGYDPDSAILGGTNPDYGTKIPNYFGLRDVVNSETRDNGVMMLDADRYNSTSTVEEPDGELLENTFTSALISPSINLMGIDGGNALLTYNQYLRVCCAGFEASLDVSVDGGSNWVQFDIYTPFQVNDGDEDLVVTLNISEVLQNAVDLSDVRLRFNWTGNQTHYFWSIDDVKITALPANDLVAGETFTNNYFEMENTVFDAVNPTSTADYFYAFEYYDQPEYYTRPYNFGMVVTNAGAETQDEVTLTVTGISPDGTEIEWNSEPISIEAGVTDTLKISNKLLIEISDPLEIGQYTFDFSVSQMQEDEIPGNNSGDSRGTIVSNEVDNDGFAIMRNDANSYQGSYNQIGQDVIWATSYVFPELQAETEPKVITHVEAVFLFSEDFAETVVGETVYFNVRKNHPFDEVEGQPLTESTVFFGSNNLTYDDEELEYIIQEEDLWNPSNGLPFVWASFPLSTPILIEPGVIYLAEYRIPAAVGGIVFPPVTTESEPFSSALYDFADGDWFSLGLNAMPIRFRTTSLLGIDDLTYESGLTLIQNYPNPMTDVTRIQYSVEKSTTATLEIRDITGKLIFTKGLGTLSANVPQTYELQRGDLAPGVYTYSLVTPESQITRKLTVQ